MNKTDSNKLYIEFTQNITKIDNDVQKGCRFATTVKDAYEIWQKNATNKEAQMKLKNALDTWKRK